MPLGENSVNVSFNIIIRVIIVNTNRTFSYEVTHVSLSSFLLINIQNTAYNDTEIRFIILQRRNDYREEKTNFFFPLDIPIVSRVTVAHSNILKTYFI